MSARYWADVARTDDPATDGMFGAETHVIGDDTDGGVVAVVSGESRADAIRDALNRQADGPVVELTGDALRAVVAVLAEAKRGGARVRVMTRADGLIVAVGAGVWSTGIGTVR